MLLVIDIGNTNTVIGIFNGQKLLKEWLGHNRFKKTPLDALKDRVGIATGLAWTEVGGEVLEIETAVIPGKGSVTLTGQQGDVMQESGQAALSYIRSRTTELGLKNTIFTNKDIHIHMPEGSTPKDGPSAGVTMATALVSMLTGKPARKDLAMTGELTLTGHVLPIGGVKEKVIAARRVGIKHLIFPKANEKDFDELPDYLKQTFEVHFVRRYEDVFKVAFS